MATEAVKVTYVEAAAPSTPAAGRTVTYAKADGLMYSKDDAGVETLMSGGAGGGSVATDAIWDAGGDLVQGTGANTAARLALGAAGTVLRSTGSAAAWGAPIGTDYASASTNTAHNVVTGAAVMVVNFEDVATDPGSDITIGASWVYTAPTTGIYYVSTRVTLASATTWSAATERGLLQLFLNGSVYRLLDYQAGWITAGAGIQVSLQGSTLVSLTATNTIDVRVAQNSGTDIALDGSAANNYIDIYRVA
jgi:hypothetical protein